MMSDVTQRIIQYEKSLQKKKLHRIQRHLGNHATSTEKTYLKAMLRKMFLSWSCKKYADKLSPAQQSVTCKR